MNILLLGEYSNVHWTLASGLKSLGHSVVVASNGDFWKKYPCDILLERKSNRITDSIAYLCKVLSALRKMRGFDVVQIINPMFLELKAKHIHPIYNYIKRHNKKVYLAAYGMDYYYVKGCLGKKLFRYSELITPTGELRSIAQNIDAIKDWTGNSDKQRLNEHIAQTCNGIIAGLWEYYQCYKEDFNNKLGYIPFPVEPIPTDSLPERYYQDIDKVRFFIGIQSSRSKFKGTDILLDILTELEKDFPDKMHVIRAENVPFAEYKKLMLDSDILVDQLYSPSPNMNSLLAMSQGLAVAGGGWEEPYTLLGEEKLRPVIDLPCTPQEIRAILLEYINNPSRIREKKKESVEFIGKYHTPLIVAGRWIDFINR